MINGREGGIRTPGPRKGTTHFECAPFDHSGTSPNFLSVMQSTRRAGDSTTTSLSVSENYVGWLGITDRRLRKSVVEIYGKGPNDEFPDPVVRVLLWLMVAIYSVNACQWAIREANSTLHNQTFR